MSNAEKWPRPRKRIRLGDAVATVAQPIARAIDRVAGTDLQNCGACKRRQARWNGQPEPEL